MVVGEIGEHDAGGQRTTQGRDDDLQDAPVPAHDESPTPDGLADQSWDSPPQARRDPSGTIVGFSLLTNAAAAASALTGAALTGSAVLLGAGLLAAADAGAQVGLLAGRRHDRRLHARSSAHHPLDTRPHRLFWFFAAGVVLTTLAGVAILSVGAERLADPLPPASPETAAAFAAGALVAKIISLAITTRAVQRALPAGPDLTGTHLIGYLLRASRPEPAVVVRQDALAVAVFLVALSVLVAAASTSDIATFDAGGAVAVGGILIIGAVLHVIQMKAMLVASPAGSHYRQSITAAIEIEPTVVRLAHLEMYHLGPQELLVGAKVELIGDLHTSELTDTIRRLADSIRRAVPAACVVYVEPDAPCSTPLDKVGPLGTAGVFASGGTYLLTDKTDETPAAAAVDAGPETDTSTSTGTAPGDTGTAPTPSAP